MSNSNELDLSIKLFKLEAEKEISVIRDLEELSKFKNSFLGKKGKIAKLKGSIKSLAPEDRPAYGERINNLESKIFFMIIEKEQNLIDLDIKTQNKTQAINTKKSYQSDAKKLEKIIGKIRFIFVKRWSRFLIVFFLAIFCGIILSRSFSNPEILVLIVPILILIPLFLWRYSVNNLYTTDDGKRKLVEDINKKGDVIQAKIERIIRYAILFYPVLVFSTVISWDEGLLYTSSEMLERKKLESRERALAIEKERERVARWQAYLQSYDFKIRIGGISKDFKKNPVRAEEKYKGQRIYTVGDIQSIFTSGNLVVFKIQDAKYSNNVLGLPIISRDDGNLTCRINRKEDKSYLNFNTGDTITVKGSFSKKDFSRYQLKNCILFKY